jgi:hypothetical protein
MHIVTFRITDERFWLYACVFIMCICLFTLQNFDENKLYASEVLGMLVNSDSAIQARLGDAPSLEGVDQLLQACAQYR